MYLGVLEDEGIGVIVPDEELEVKIDGLLPGENIAQLLNPVLKLLLLCNIIFQTINICSNPDHIPWLMWIQDPHWEVGSGSRGTTIINSYIKQTLSLKK